VNLLLFTKMAQPYIVIIQDIYVFSVGLYNTKKEAISALVTFLFKYNRDMVKDLAIIVEEECGININRKQLLEEALNKNSDIYNLFSEQTLFHIEQIQQGELFRFYSYGTWHSKNLYKLLHMLLTHETGKVIPYFS
jgi:hypothetical protein